MQKTILLTLATGIFAVGLYSCKKESNSPEENDNELITTVGIAVVPVGSTDTTSFYWEDVDGPGGEVPVIDTIRLTADRQYSISLLLYDKTKTPFQFTNEEIIEESDVHRFYFDVSSALGLTINDGDKDKNGITLGLNDKLLTTSKASGTLTVTLRHYADGGKEEGDKVNDSKSSTDAEAIFPVVVD